MQLITLGRQHFTGVLCGVQSRLQSYYSKRVLGLTQLICMAIRLVSTMVVLSFKGR